MVSGTSKNYLIETVSQCENAALTEKGTQMERSHSCPKCGSADTFRVHRKPKEYILLGCRAHCCADCKSRFLIFELNKLLEWRSTP